MSGRVVLVGAGPGDPDLLTVRARRELVCAEVLLYDALISPAILDLAPADCVRFDVGKRGDGSRGVAQDEIAKLMIEQARAGHDVVRLKGGDPFLFGRGGEEASALVEAGISFEVVPGISSALAAPAYAGIPVTDRRASASLAVVTGHRANRDDVNDVDWEGLARCAETLVVLMGTTWLEEIVRRVLAGGRDPQTPSAVISDGTTGSQRVVTAPLVGLVERVRAESLRAPTIIVIGDVARYRASLAWYERRPLFGRRVLVLRAEVQRASLTERLARAGAVPVQVPLLALEACGEPERLRELRADWVVFGSANAVHFAAAWLPVGVRTACVGEATARAARERGLEVALLPPEGALPVDLAGLLLAHGPGLRVLLPRAEQGRDELASALAEGGAEVEPVVVYRNVEPPDAPARLREALDAGADAVLLTSPSTVERLAGILGADLARRMEEVLLVAIGPTTAAALRAHGLAGLVAERPSEQGLVAALERHYSEVSDAVSG